jgi:hypothetical protein
MKRERKGISAPGEGVGTAAGTGKYRFEKRYLVVTEVYSDVSEMIQKRHSLRWFISDSISLGVPAKTGIIEFGLG